MISPTGHNLVFVLGVPRSGTTLLCTLLGNHPDVLCPPEPWLLLAVQALGRTSPAHPADARLLATAMDEFLTGPTALDAGRACAAAAYNRRLADAGRTVLVDKTPRYYHVLDDIDELFPDARHVWIQRDPLDVAASYLTSWDVDLARLVETDVGHPAALDLVVGLLRLEAFARRRPDRVLALRYEMLVREPAARLADIAGFLGLEPRDDLVRLDPGDRHDAAPAMGDRKIRGTDHVHDRSLGTGLVTLSNEQLQVLRDALGSELLERYGREGTLAALDTRGVVDHGPEATAAIRAGAERALAERWSEVLAPPGVESRRQLVEPLEAGRAEAQAELAALRAGHERLADEHRRLAAAHERLGREREEQRAIVAEASTALEQRRQWQRMGSRRRFRQSFKQAFHAALELVGRSDDDDSLPSIAVITPVGGDLEGFDRTAASLRRQGYEHLVHLVAGPADACAEALRLVGGGGPDRARGIGPDAGAEAVARPEAGAGPGTRGALAAAPEPTVLRVPLWGARTESAGLDDTGAGLDATGTGSATEIGIPAAPQPGSSRVPLWGARIAPEERIAAINAGLRAVESAGDSEILTWLDPGDELAPGVLNRVGRTLRRRRRIHAAHLDGVIAANGWCFPAPRSPVADLFSALAGAGLPTGGVFIRREPFRSIRRLDEHHPLAAEDALWLALTRWFRLCRVEGDGRIVRHRPPPDPDELRAQQVAVRDEFRATLRWITTARRRPRAAWRRAARALRDRARPQRWRSRLDPPPNLAGPVRDPEPPDPAPRAASPDRLLLTVRGGPGDAPCHHLIHLDETLGLAWRCPARLVPVPSGGSPADEDAWSPFRGHVEPRLPARTGDSPAADLLRDRGARTALAGGLGTNAVRLHVEPTTGHGPDGVEARLETGATGDSPAWAWCGPLAELAVVLPESAVPDLIDVAPAAGLGAAPDRTVRRLATLLPAGGRIVVGLPSLDSALLEQLGPTWSLWQHPRHATYLHRRAAGWLAVGTDLRAVRVATITGPDDVARSLQITADGLGRPLPEDWSPPPELERRARMLAAASRRDAARGRGDWMIVVMQRT